MPRASPGGRLLGHYRSIARVQGNAATEARVRASHRALSHSLAVQSTQPESRTTKSSRRHRASRLVLVGSDVTIVCVTAIATSSKSPWTVGYWTLVLAFLALSGTYRVKIALLALNELPVLAKRLMIPVLTALAAPTWLTIESSIATQAMLTFPVLMASRVVAYGALRQARRRNQLNERVAIIGSGDIAVEIARLLQLHREYGLTPVGFVDSVPAHERSRLPLPVLGPVHHLELLLDDHGIRHVIVADGYDRDAEAEWLTMLRTAVLNDQQVHVVPRFLNFGMGSASADVDEIWGIPLYRVRRSAARTAAWRMKRIIDLSIGITLLVLMAPLMAIIALAVRVDSPGPIIYRQRRVGQHGKLFELLKFRSMRTSHDGMASWTAASEDQTTIGRLLRKTSLDELPQLWNVIRGDMSLVGPRPERPYFVRRFASEIPTYLDRHRVSVGITGWAQVHGLKGEGTSLYDRTRFDNFYIERWSLWLDFVAIARTAATITHDVLDGIAAFARQQKGTGADVSIVSEAPRQSPTDQRDLTRSRS